jgi:hypothetical protein
MLSAYQKAPANSLASKNLDIGFAIIQELNTFAVP